MHDNDDSTRFTIRDDRQAEAAAPDTLYQSDAETLRIEKLSTRITLVSVLIPCLLVVVLTVAYLDIKKRVINTQTSGSMGVQNLSKDLESRFSNLSLKQAKIEEQLLEQAKTVEATTAAVQVNLKKQTDEIKRIVAHKADQATVDKLAAGVKQASSDITALRQEMTDLGAAFDKFDAELAGQIQLIADGLKRDQGRLTEIEKTAQRLDTEKMSKEALDLAMGIERLSIQEMVKDNLRKVDRKLADLNKTVDGLDRRIDSLAKKIATQPSPTTAPAPVVKPNPPPAPAPSTGGAGITEQTIE